MFLPIHIIRLLELKSDGDVSLTKDLISDISPYAILSHTWGAEDEEVTFKDLTQSSGETKLGYDKILFRAKQASKDGLHTYCIDKPNNSELSGSHYLYVSLVSQCGQVLRLSIGYFGNWPRSDNKHLWAPAFHRADGLPVVGHLKNSLLYHQVNSSQSRASCLE